MIPVNKPFLPDKKEYNSYLSQIWSSSILTNMGPLGSQLELDLARYLGLEEVCLVSNGTVALQLAIKALSLKGEIITTPFSFVATTSSIVWEGCTPVFVDIDPQSLNIDPKKVEASITSRTVAILATHVYGNPCDVLALEAIANRYSLKIIYDGAHAFNVKFKGMSIFEFGDLSTCSTHATKLYHSVEGGFLASRDLNMLNKIRIMRNFGFVAPDEFGELGINAKNSEFHSAMGLVMLSKMEEVMAKRKLLYDRYKANLCGLPLNYQVWSEYSENNYSYFPIILDSEEVLLRTMNFLQLNGISTRRYFYPALSSSLPYLKVCNMEVVDDISRKILCLPFFTDLELADIDLVSSKVHQVLKF